MTQRRDQGLALILVMTVVMALAIIATPFVISMLLQERTGTAAPYLSQADYGADGAKNYAMWRLMQSLDPIERRSGTGVFSSYYYATRGAFALPAEDDQGKLNAPTCNVDALQNLARMVDGRVVNLKDYITLYSGRDATWVCP